MWQYHVDEPVSAVGVLPVDGVVRGTRPLYIVQRDVPPKRVSRNHDPEILHAWDVFNSQVRLPMDQDTLLQCRVFRPPKILKKHHVIKVKIT